MNPVPLFLIIVTLPLLLGLVCNAELRTWTAVNGKEVIAEFVSNEKGIVKLKLKSGKVFEVPANKLSKEDNEFISSLAKPDGVNEDELERRENIIYLKGSDTPYTGKSFSLDKKGTGHETNYKDGKLEGPNIWWVDGKKGLESNYKGGFRHGLTVGWHENGQKSFESNYKDGKQNGLHVIWHDNGQKQSEAIYKNNLPDGMKTQWYSNGQKEMEERFKNGKKDGLGVSWYLNGQKAKEINYKDDKVDGLWLEWYRDGQKMYEKNCKDGKRDGLWIGWHNNGQKMLETNYKIGRKVEGSAKFWNKKGEVVNSLEEAYEGFIPNPDLL